MTTTHPPQLASVGLPFVITELKTCTALANARAYLPAAEEIYAKGVTPYLHVYTHSQDDFDLRTVCSRHWTVSKTLQRAVPTAP